MYVLILFIIKKYTHCMLNVFPNNVSCVYRELFTRTIVPWQSAILRYSTTRLVTRKLLHATCDESTLR